MESVASAGVSGWYWRTRLGHSARLIVDRIGCYVSVDGSGRRCLKGGSRSPMCL